MSTPQYPLSPRSQPSRDINLCLPPPPLTNRVMLTSNPRNASVHTRLITWTTDGGEDRVQVGGLSHTHRETQAHACTNTQIHAGTHTHM